MRSSVAAVDAVDTAPPGSSSGQSSSGGSGSSSPQREEDTTLETEIVPLAELPGQPEQAELDLWNSLMTLDGARAAFFRRARSFFSQAGATCFCARVSLFAAPRLSRACKRLIPLPPVLFQTHSCARLCRGRRLSLHDHAQQPGVQLSRKLGTAARAANHTATDARRAAARATDHAAQAAERPQERGKGLQGRGRDYRRGRKARHDQGPRGHLQRLPPSGRRPSARPRARPPRGGRGGGADAAAARPPAATLASAAASAPSAEDPTQMLLGPGRLDMSTGDAELAMKSAAAAAARVY